MKNIFQIIIFLIIIIVYEIQVYAAACANVVWGTSPFIRAYKWSQYCRYCKVL